MVVMSPSGDVAAQQRDLIVISTALMLLIVVPVIGLIALFAWRYRESNTKATYDPDWHHSTQLEVVIWAAPLVIIIALGAITWVFTHLLDPYRPITRIDSYRTFPADAKPINVQAVALDWKWLFIYPDLGIATVNELAAPLDEQLNFKLTASTVMNSLYIPALAGQIFAMPGMQTKLHAVINRPGVYDGFSANYSGAGFSDMRFKFHGMSRADFDKWVQSAKDAGGSLDGKVYLELEKPSVKEPPRRFASVEPGLYDKIVNMCVDPARMCMREMAAIDRKGGLGKDEGLRNVFASDVYRPGQAAPRSAHQTRFVAAQCTPMAPRDGRVVEIETSPADTPEKSDKRAAADAAAAKEEIALRARIAGDGQTD